MEPWIGGRLRIDIEDAGKQFYVSGTYTDLDRPNRLGFTWSCSTWPDPTLTSQVLVTLVPRGPGQTLMTITHSALTPDLTDQHLRGWCLIGAARNSRILVTLVPRGPDQTAMTITRSGLTPYLTDQHLPGWRLIADQLDAALEQRMPC